MFDIRNANLRFLEAGDTEAVGNACRPLTICDQHNNDLANIYSSDDTTTSVARDEAIAYAHLFAAAPKLLWALEALVEAAGSPDGVNLDIWLDTARGALTAAKGESDEGLDHG